jgi:hypothetical protein
MTETKFAEFYYENYFENSSLFSENKKNIKDYSEKIKLYEDEDIALIEEIREKLEELQKYEMVKNYSGEQKMKQICVILNHYCPCTIRENKNLEDLDLNCLIKSKLIAKEVEYEEGYYYNETYGLELCIMLYEFDNYYLQIDFSHQNNTERLEYGLFEFLNKTCTVYRKDDYKNKMFLDKVSNMSTILYFFKNKYSKDEYRSRFDKYIDYRYKQIEKEELKKEKRLQKINKKNLENFKNQIGNVV